MDLTPGSWQSGGAPCVLTAEVLMREAMLPFLAIFALRLPPQEYGDDSACSLSPVCSIGKLMSDAVRINDGDHGAPGVAGTVDLSPEPPR